MTKFNETTTPAILRSGDNDWKVSPFGPDDPDRDCFWVETKKEAIEECEAIVAAPSMCEIAAMVSALRAAGYSVAQGSIVLDALHKEGRLAE